MVMRRWRLRRRGTSLKEVLFLLLLLHLLGRFRIHLLHLGFLGLRERGEMANKHHKSPTIDVVVTGRAERGHAAEHDAVLNSVVEFSIRHCLSFLAAHIRGAG